MAQLAISAAGAAVGFLVGGPIGGQLGWAAGSLLGAAFGPGAEGPRLSDTKVQISSYGATLPRAWGGLRVAGNVIWSDDLVESASSGGGKGGPATSSFSYTVSCAVAIVDGPIVGIRKIWADAKLVYDISADADSDTYAASSAFAEYFTLYLGSESQLPDPTIEAIEGVGQVEAYRGTSYIVFTDLPLADYGNRVPSFSFEVLTAASTEDPVTGPWTLSRGPAPEHGPGPTLYSDLAIMTTLDGETPIAGTFSRLSDAVAAIQAELGPRYGNVICWGSSDNPIPNVFATGAEIDSDDPTYCYAYVACDPVLAGGLMDLSPPVNWAVPFQYLEPTHPDDYETGTTYLHRGGWESGAPIGVGLMKFVWSTAAYLPPLLYPDALAQEADVHGPLYPLIDIGPPPAGYYPTVVKSDLVRIKIARVPYVPTAPEPVPLSDIVADICNAAGLADADIDVSELTDLVDGYRIARQMSGRAALEPLRQAFYFDAVEDGDTVVFVKRGGTAAASLTADELGAGLDAGDSVRVAATRSQETELPAEINVAYEVRAADYQTGTQRARRITTGSRQVVGVELPIVMTDDKGAEVADVLMYDAWVGRVQRSFATTRARTALLPTDVVGLNDGEFDYTGRIIEKVEDGPVIRWLLRETDPAAYSPNSVGSVTSGGGGAVRYDGPMRVVLMDLPALRDDDDDAGFYAAADGYRPSFHGGRLFKSVDGSTYAVLQTLDVAATLGAATSVLPDYAGGNTVDEISRVTVELSSGAIEGITRAELLNAGNLALLGNELVCFMRADLVGGSTYTLSGLLRGRRGTEQHMGTHSLGERFVLLDSATVYRVAQSLAQIGSAFYKPVAYGTALADAVPQAFDNTAAALKPLSPAHLFAAPVPGTSPQEYAVQWVRRGRLGGSWRDLVDVPLAEGTESYLVEVLLGPAVLSSATVTSPSATVEADSGETIRVTQLSTTVGRGFPATFEIA